MKRRHSILAMLLTSLLLLGALAGCTGTTQEAEQPTDADSTTQAEQPTPALTIEAADGNATVTTAQGLTYTASGYSTVESDAFCFANGLTLQFDEQFADSFNRFTMQYVASAPMKITITYTEKDEEMQDSFYLEAGERTFSAVNHKFISKVSGDHLASMKIDTCLGQDASFVLLGLTTETISVPKSQIYLTGSRYTLGVDLKWGGAIHSLEDTQCPLEDVTNLCNMHDEGRLIQQSYYGVFYYADQYEEGGYQGQEGVAYNPVQGGDVKGRDSRLIDVVIEKNSIYVKAQPLDWPMTNSLTPSYMENKYVMENDYIYVYNRFVDFSGWEHPVLDQELPAVYTVNVLDTFVWYNGDNSWTGDTLTFIDDWSRVDAATGKSMHYLIRQGANTETWCALINGDTQYGVGIYVPNTDKVLAMRYKSGQKGSNQGKGDPCSYMCPINYMQIVSYQPIEYTYLLTAGNLDEMRTLFTENRDYDTNASLDVKTPARNP